MDGDPPVPASGPVNVELEDESRLAKFLCSFGGSVLPRPLDGRLRYVGGETRIVTVPHDISFYNLLKRMREIFEGADIIKYQQPDEDFDALVSLFNDDDVINMMEEYDKLISSGEAFTRLRIFLFSQNALEVEVSNSPSPVFDAVSERESERRYIDALNCFMDPKSDLNSSDKDCSLHCDINSRNLNVSRPSVYSQKFVDVDTPYNGAGYFSPRFHNPQTHDLFRNLPVGSENLDEKSGYIGQFSRGGHLLNANGNYCEHCLHAPYHQRSGCVTPDARYLDLPHCYYIGHVHNGFNNQCGDCYRNNREFLVENKDYYNYYQDEAQGHDRSSTPHTQVSYHYEDPRTNRVHDPFIPDGSRSNYLYQQGNIHDAYDSTHFCNHQIATAVGNNELFHNTVQQGENYPRHYKQAAMHNMDSLYQVPQNLPPIPSLRRKMQVNKHPAASPTAYESPKSVGINPAIVRVNPDGTPSGGLNPDFARISQEKTPSGVNPIFVRGPPDGNPNSGINPVLVKAIMDGTPNGGINSVFVKGAPDANPTGGIKTSFMIGTPEDSPRMSGVGRYERIPNQRFGYTENCSQKISDIDLCTSMPEYGQQLGSRLNPNFPTQDNGLQCQIMTPITGPLISGTLVTEGTVTKTPIIRASIMEPLVNESGIIETPVYEPPAAQYSINEAPIIETVDAATLVTPYDYLSKKGDVPPFGTSLSGKEMNEPNVLFEPENEAVGVEKPVKEEVHDENHVGENEIVLKDGDNPVKQLTELVKTVSLEGAQAMKAKEKANDEESNLNEVMLENGNMDFEIILESSKSEDLSKLEPTSAKLEALDKGLQTIKNEDLEEIRELGHGTYGAVYHGKWRGSDVAIKRIKASCFAGRPSEREKLITDFWKEAQILSSLHHPNVVSFYGVVRDGPDGGFATVTEYMVNGSLKQFLHKKDRTIDRRKRIILAMDAAFGMEYLHSKNIVHFDLKCENLLVNMKDTHRPICKIGDLGLSKVKQHTMVSGGVRGTLPWMAPELLNGKSNMVSEKVDVYSFGICLWELLTGEEPYADMKAHSIIGGIMNDSLRPQISAWCDPEWKTLMQSCWSTNPNERPSFSEISQKLRKMAPK